MPVSMSTTCSNCGAALEASTRFCPSCGARALHVDADAGLIGKTFNGKYHVVSELGTGAMGTVFLGEHLGLKKKIALKVLHPDLGLS